MDIHPPPDYTQYIENENEALPATAIHRHAQAGYHTTKPGQKLVPGITIDFDLCDPFFVEYKPGEYSSLHDPNLKHFLNKKSVRRCLIKNNLIGKDGWVKCTLQEFNRFQRNLKHYFKVQKRIATQIERKKVADPRKVLRNKYKESMLQKRIQHNVKIAEARARHTDSMMKKRKHIMNRIVQKDKQMFELISRVRLEREDMDGQAELERKRRELLKIRLDSTELIRQHTILQRIRQKERMVNQKQLVKKQRRIKKIYKMNLEWHEQRMSAKEDEMCKFLSDEQCKQGRRTRSISLRNITAEQNKNSVSGHQKTVFNQHQRIEDIHLEEARQWEKKVEDKRVVAANNWRAKMHCMQSIAEGRMADIERRKFERKRNAVARKKAQIEEDLDMVEKMNVTVLGTTGYGSHELANIHRDNSKLRFSAYHDPGRDMIDPCRVTQFHSYFKPLYVINAKYQPGFAPTPPTTLKSSKPYKKRHEIPKQSMATMTSMSSYVSCVFEDTDQLLLDELMNEFMDSELSDIINEYNEEIKPVVDIVDDLVDNVEKESEGYKLASRIVEEVVESVEQSLMDIPNLARILQMQSIMSLDSDTDHPNTYSSTRDTDWNSTQYTNTLHVEDLVYDVVHKIMACFDGKHDEVYREQTSTTDCCVEDGESIITKIIVRLINTIQNFTFQSTMSSRDSAESMLSAGNSISRDSIKDLHKRAQFLLNHALDVAKVKLKMKGYSYLTWNILEDAMIKGRDIIMAENPGKIGQFTDVEVIEWIIDEARVILRGATTVLFETLHGDDKSLQEKGSYNSSNEEIVEECYLDQLKKIENEDNQIELSPSEFHLERYLEEGDVAKFAIALTQKTIGYAMTGIPRRTSMILAEALKDGNFDLAGSILSAKAITVAYKDMVLDPLTPSTIDLRKALRLGDVLKSGAILAKKAIQQAMKISCESDTPLEHAVSNLVLQHALRKSNYEEVDEITVEKGLREALAKLALPTPDALTLDDALEAGDLEAAANFIINDACAGGIEKLIKEEHADVKEEKQVTKIDGPSTTKIERPSSPTLEKASSNTIETEIPSITEIGRPSSIKIGRTSSTETEKPSSIKIESPSSVVLNNALFEGKLSIAGDIMMERALRSGLAEVNPADTTLIRRDSSINLENALNSGELDIAGDIIVKRLLGELGETEDVPQVKSDVLLEQYLQIGDLEAAAPILINRALIGGMQDLREEDENNASSEVSSVTNVVSQPEVLSKTAIQKSDIKIDGHSNRALVLKSVSPFLNKECPPTKSPSDMALETALEKGDLEIAGNIITERAFKSVSPLILDTEMLPTTSPSDLALDDALEKGDLETAGEILADRALNSATPSLEKELIPAKTPSDEALETALDTGDLETAGDIIANRALRSVSPSFIVMGNESPPPKSTSDKVLETVDECEGGFGEESDPPQVISVHSYEDLVVSEDVSDVECVDVEATIATMNRAMSDMSKLNDGIYILEHFANTNKETRGYDFLKHVVESVFDDLEDIFDKECQQNFPLLQDALILRDYYEASVIVFKLLFDKSRDVVVRELGESVFACHEGYDIVSKFVLLVCRSILECGIEAFRGSFSNEMSHAAGQLLNDFIRETVTYHSNHGLDLGDGHSIVALILTKAINHIVCPDTKEMRRASSLELFKATQDGDETKASEILVDKVLQRAEMVVSPNEEISTISEFKSATDILNEQAQKTIQKYSNTSLSRKSKKKVHSEGLPMPKPSSKSSVKSSTSSYEPVRDMLISEEREARINKIVSNSLPTTTSPSKQSIRTKSYTDLKSKPSIERLSECCEGFSKLMENHQRDIGDTFSPHDSDLSLPLERDSSSTSTSRPSSSGYIRKIQSKGHVYYIDSEGVIKKRIKKKRASKKRISQDDFVIRDNSTADDLLDSSDPKAVSSESSLLQPTPPPVKMSDTSRRNSAGSFKKKNSNLQMLAVINSSYTNMMGKKSGSQISSSQSLSKVAAKKPSIEEMLSETDKELIKKLSYGSQSLTSSLHVDQDEDKPDDDEADKQTLNFEK